MMLPGFSFGELFDLFIEVIDNFLMLSLEQMGCFFRFQMDIFKKFAHLDNFNITFTVDVKLKDYTNHLNYDVDDLVLIFNYLALATTFGFFQTFR